MKKYIFFSLFLLLFFLAAFVVVDYFQVPVLNDPSFFVEKGGWIAALGGIALLALDIVLPVPSSLIMIANGALFGILWGTVLSMIGGMAASLAGFFIGRKSQRWIARLIDEKDRTRASALMDRWGLMAIIVTRSVPLLSETLSIVAGTTSLSFGKMALESFAGLLPGAIVYAVAGASAGKIDNTVYSFLLVLAVAGCFWLGGKLFSVFQKNKKSVSENP